MSRKGKKKKERKIGFLVENFVGSLFASKFRHLKFNIGRDKGDACWKIRQVLFSYDLRVEREKFFF